MDYKMSLSEIVKKIKSLNVKTQTIYTVYEKKYQENAELKININKLYTQIQKQTLLKNKLMEKIMNFDKTKKDLEDELNIRISNNRIMESKINIQFEEIQKLMGERLEREKENKYYKSLCKNLMTEDILSNKIAIKNAKKFTDEHIILNKKYQRSKKDMKTVLGKIELNKYNYLSYFDENYDNVDKTNIIKLIASTFNQLINIGYICYWESKAKMFIKHAKVWTVDNPSGMPIQFITPFNQTIISFPTTDAVPSFEPCYRLKTAKRINENKIENNNQNTKRMSTSSP
ncbi:hypothetical protein AGLY_012714 [Aphis glycines]|uniref:Uncharacterized protein n=1 Tax=Aphis glycines TaxID=307491 RepID=A0A6G0T8F2_APHGL|nr:hypothetical protein AGLY_012714 [Aphis glycines]